jgi:predicted membrane-bound spermidine synthase
VLAFSRWGPVFRVDVSKLPDPADAMRLVFHDGMWGATLHRFDGDLSRFSDFDRDVRSLPFRVLGRPPERVAVLGSAGGREILNALYFGAKQVTGVELSPLTLSLLTEVFADYTGRLQRRPGVRLLTGEARAFLSRDASRYDLIHLVAPRTHAAMNAASSAAFLLSESYLFTAEMLVESLEHLDDEGILCAQFGEWAYEEQPLRTARYLSTAREAFWRLGVGEIGRHVMVGTSASFVPISTVLLKKTPFTDAQVKRFLAQIEVVPGSAARYAAGRVFHRGAVSEVLARGRRPLERWFMEQPYDLRPVSDDAPFFWHFRSFRQVLRELPEPFEVRDADVGVGERLLLVLLLVSAIFAAVCLLLPFAAARDRWAALPRKGRSAAYFASVGLGFMIYEICLIQKLTLLLGYPTYSLSVTLATLLVSAGLGSLATSRYAQHRGAPLALFAALLAWTLLARHALGPLIGGCLAAPLYLRIAFAVLWVAPLGIVLGGFLPLGLAVLRGLASRPSEAVAWGWAVSGFAAVVGSVLTTMLSMSFGFQAVFLIGLGTYALAVAALRMLAGRPAA